MKKNYSEDIVPPSRKRSIRDIPVPPRGGSAQRSTEDVMPLEPIEEVKPRMDDVTIPIHPIEPEAVEREEEIDEDYQINKYRVDNNKRPFLITIGTVLILIILFFILSAFDSADVKIEPKTAEAMINDVVYIENISSKKDSDTLGYRVIELSQEAEKLVQATDEEYVSKKASGIITIYNLYSKTAQKLINQTRFETPDGRIYRIQESVSVPGYTEVDGQKVPGSIDMEVFADGVGEKYNLSSSKFTIPGFAGQEPYDYFSAETKTEISGGYDGVRKIISEDSLESAKNDLSTNLTSKLIDEVNEHLTDDLIAIYNTDSFNFGDIEQEDVSGTDEVLLRRKGSIKAYVFDRVELSNILALAKVVDYRVGQNVLIEDLDSMVTSISIDEGDEEIEGDEKERMDISGNAVFVWQNNDLAIKNALIGTKKSNLYNTLQGFDGIAGATAVIKPFWKRKFPKTIDDIDIVIVE